MSTGMKKEFSKAKKVSHPNSRKSLAIVKRAKKITKREKAKLRTVIKQSLIGEKMMWIKENMQDDVCPYTPELTAVLLEMYIARNDKELEQIQIKRSIGMKRNKQHASREDVIRMTKKREQEEYNTCGIEIPDILTASQCEMLKNWDGELKLLPNFKFRRFGKKDLLQKKANEPPKESKMTPESNANQPVVSEIKSTKENEPSESDNTEVKDSQEANDSESSAMEVE